MAVELAGCSHHFAEPAFVGQPPSALVEVTEPPPPGRVEFIPQRPTRTAVWVDGEWSWRRRKWAWLAGRWVEAPPGAKYSLWAFVRGPDGRLWVAAGAWRDAKGAVLEAPQPLVSARVTSSEVINAAGVLENTGRTLSAAPKEGD
jgi:hypothetical protein